MVSVETFSSNSGSRTACRARRPRLHPARQYNAAHETPTVDRRVPDDAGDRAPLRRARRSRPPDQRQDSPGGSGALANHANAPLLLRRIWSQAHGVAQSQGGGRLGGKQMSDWGFTNAHLEPWEFGHPGWSNEHLEVHMTSPVHDALVVEALAWTPGTNGTVTANAFNLVPPEGPAAASARHRLRDRARSGTARRRRSWRISRRRSRIACAAPPFSSAGRRSCRSISPPRRAA